MSTLYKEYRRELKKVLMTKDPDRLIEFSNQWATKIKNERMSRLKDQPRHFVELVMHQMIAGISNIPDEIRKESEKWLEEFRQNHANDPEYQPNDDQSDEMDDLDEGEMRRQALLLIRQEIFWLKEAADKYPYSDTSKIPDARHYADLPGIDAPRICFTKRDRDSDGKKWYYHLSVSSREGMVDDETVEFLLEQFGSPQGVTETPGPLNGGSIRHFWWPCNEVN
jgi:hypothetical protein